MFEEYREKTGDIVTGIVQQSDQRYTLVDLGKVEALLPLSEQIQGERYKHGMRIKVYIVEVRKTSKGPQILVSRTHPGLLKRLFELEVPEIAEGYVEIKAVAREPGHRSKIAVVSHDRNIDPVGACVGARGSRVRMVVNELKGEKVDIVPWKEDPGEFVSNALSPAKVKEVGVYPEEELSEVIVPDSQLSLAIGKEGQNARLAAKLTGWRIDIKSESQARDEREGYTADAEVGEDAWREEEETGDGTVSAEVAEGDEEGDEKHPGEEMEEGSAVQGLDSGGEEQAEEP
jgi:transcription termination/antitermination protein NusA